MIHNAILLDVMGDRSSYFYGNGIGKNPRKQDEMCKNKWIELIIEPRT